MIGAVYYLIRFFNEVDLFAQKNIYITALFIAVMVLLFSWVNYTFAIKIKKFLQLEHTREEILTEFLKTVATGVSNIVLFAIIYVYFGISQGELVVKGDFIVSLYFSIVTWTTLGYGDFSPIPVLRLVAAVEALVGYIYMALLIGLFFNLISNKKV